MTPLFDDAFYCKVATETERRTQIERLINTLGAAGEELAYDFSYQCQVYDSLNFDSDTLTEKEVDYIEKELARRFDDKWF